MGALDRDLARLRERDPARDAAQELDAELLLEPSQLLRDGGLCNPQLPGGDGEAAALGHGREVAKLPELHAR